MEIRGLARGEWPPQLQETSQPPERLWLRGALPVPGTKFLTVVGSRALTRYGREAAAQGAAPELAGAECAVWELLGTPRTRDELLRASGALASETLTALATLELRGLAKEEFGEWRRA